MCEPASIIAVTSLAIGAASSAYSYYQSNQQANQAASLAQQTYDLERRQQIEIYNSQVKQQQLEYDRQASDASLQYQRAMQQRNAQVDAQNAQYQQLSRQSQAASSTSLARAAEAGVGGLSVDALMSDYWRQELDSRLALDTERNAIDMQASNNFYDYKTGQDRNRTDFVTGSKNQYATYKYGIESGNLGLSNQMLKINDARTSTTQLGLNLGSSLVTSADTYYRLKQPSPTASRLPSKSTAKLG
jgi:hypothetical protein